MIELDVAARRLHLEVSDEELARRRAAVAAACAARPRLGTSCTSSTCCRRDQGADLDFLVGASGAGIPREPAILREIQHLLHLEAPTVNGKTIGENIANAPCWNREVIRPLDKPFMPDAGIAVLRGNLAPDGAVIKPSAASAHLLQHRGRAVVFETIEDFHARIDDETSTSTSTASWC